MLAPLWLLIFRAEYSLEEQADELEVVPLDGITHQVLAQTPELVEYWEALAPEPPTGVGGPPPVPPAAAGGAARRWRSWRSGCASGWARSAARARAISRRETASIEAYYRQLIDEVRNAGRRWALAPAQRDERIRMLQLDWKRRSEDARRAWEPQIEIALAAAGAAMLPRIRWTVSSAAPPAGGARPEARPWLRRSTSGGTRSRSSSCFRPAASAATPRKASCRWGRPGLLGSECHARCRGRRSSGGARRVDAPPRVP